MTYIPRKNDIVQLTPEFIGYGLVRGRVTEVLPDGRVRLWVNERYLDLDVSAIDCRVGQVIPAFG